MGTVRTGSNPVYCEKPRTASIKDNAIGDEFLSCICIGQDCQGKKIHYSEIYLLSWKAVPHSRKTRKYFFTPYETTSLLVTDSYPHTNNDWKKC